MDLASYHSPFDLDSSASRFSSLHSDMALLPRLAPVVTDQAQRLAALLAKLLALDAERVGLHARLAVEDVAAEIVVRLLAQPGIDRQATAVVEVAA
ncbi:hypothetical protein D9M68_854040 [compost metagenome]